MCKHIENGQGVSVTQLLACRYIAFARPLSQTVVKDISDIANKIGNKILLEEDINKSIGNEWFKTKKQKSINDKAGYKDSKYHIARALIDYPKDTWTKEDIETMTVKIAERISKFIFEG